MDSFLLVCLIYAWAIITASNTNLTIFIILAPLHVEEISKDPEITIFHDFLSDEDMKFLKYTIMSEMKVTYIDEVFQFYLILELNQLYTNP